MTLRDLPALFMRGGTSKALVFDVRDLPPHRADWDRIFLAAMGSPDPHMRQLDGMGGGISSLSKVCVVGPPSAPDADINFTFAQIPVSGTGVDYAGNCGNMVSAMGPAALELAYVAVPGDGEACVRIHNTNTGKIIVSRFPVEDGRLAPDGDLALDGVAGTAAPIKLDFLDPGGSKTGALLPTGNASDTLTLPDDRTVEASLVDAANPCVFVAATDLGKSGTEHPDDLSQDRDFLDAMEMIRQAGSARMGMAADLEAARHIASIPKVAIVASPAAVTTIDGAHIPASDISLLVRMISMEQPHKAVPVTGAICLAVACRIPGSVPHGLCSVSSGALALSHPSGSILVDAEVEAVGSDYRAISGRTYRSARKLFSGSVHFRDL